MRPALLDDLAARVDEPALGDDHSLIRLWRNGRGPHTISCVTVQGLRQRLEERRRRALGLVKALDRCAVSLTARKSEVMRRFAECDGDCLAWLARLTPLSPRAPAPSGWSEIDDIEREMDRLQETILASLPKTRRRQVEQAYEVGQLIVDDDEIYEGVRGPRRP